LCTVRVRTREVLEPSIIGFSTGTNIGQVSPSTNILHSWCGAARPMTMLLGQLMSERAADTPPAF